MILSEGKYADSSLSQKDTPGGSSLFQRMAIHLLAAIRANLTKRVLTLRLLGKTE